MKNTNHINNTVISASGEKQLLRAAQMTSFLSELLIASSINGTSVMSQVREWRQ